MSYSFFLGLDSNSLPPFAFVLTCLVKEPVVVALLCSLLNTVVKFDPVGWGIP